MSTNTKAISDDILKVARDIAASRYIGSQWSHMRDYFADGLYDNDPVVLSAAKAIHDAAMAERERCAEICAARSKEHHASSHQWEDSDSVNLCLSDAIEALNCASAIRAAPKAEG